MKKLPLVIDGDLLIQSLEHKLVRAKSKVLGTRHGDFIIIETPVLQFNDRLSSTVTGALRCRFLDEGDCYDFLSRVREQLKHGMTLIDYPDTHEHTSLRADIRIHVNIETRLEIEKQRDTLTAAMTDISAGGCRLELPFLHAVTKDSRCTLAFVLPDGKAIEKLAGITCQSTLSKLAKKTEFGVRFIEPASELEKVSAFCRFCEYFQV